MITQRSKALITLPAAISIGIGGMIGAGIFSVLGLVAIAAGAAMWISFLIGGIIALFSTYSYAKLGAKYPSAGGAVQFLVAGWGTGTVSGGFNYFMWIAYLISIALYAQGFSAYFMTFFPGVHSVVIARSVAIGIVVIFTLINFLGARSVGSAETFIVAVKVSILVLFACIGIFFIHPENLAPVHWAGAGHILFGAGILFIGYEGFGLITNAAADMYNPEKNLAKTLYLSVIIVIVIYLCVAVTVTGNLSPQQISASGDYALAQAAQPFLGKFGFRLIALAALFSTASAINATLFGASNVIYMIARDGELTRKLEFAKSDALGGLIVSALITIIFILFFDLSGIAMMGSGAFLLVYGAVHAGHLRILAQTGAKKWIVAMSLFLCAALFCILEYHTFQVAPAAVYTTIMLLIACFICKKIIGYYQQSGDEAVRK
jgi:amino acid transporter